MKPEALRELLSSGVVVVTDEDGNLVDAAVDVESGTVMVRHPLPAGTAINVAYERFPVAPRPRKIAQWKRERATRGRR